MLQLPECPDEDWAPAFHMKTKRVHALGCYLANEIVLVNKGFLLYQGEPIYQPDIVVPYIANMIEKEPPSDIRADAGSGVISLKNPALVAWDVSVKTYGHFLIDVLPRLLIFEKLFDQELGNCAIIFPHDLPTWAIEILRQVFPRLMENTKLVDFTQNVVRMRRAIIPTHCHYYYYFHPLARLIFDELYVRSAAENAEIDGRYSGLLFVSRSSLKRQTGSRDCLDIEEVESYARQAGFFVIHPEKMPWKQQLKYFRLARVVVGEYGSGLHNALFSPAGVVTIALNRIQFLQSFIGALKGQRVGYLLPLDKGGESACSWYRLGVERARRAIDFAISLR